MNPTNSGSHGEDTSWAEGLLILMDLHGSGPALLKCSSAPSGTPRRNPSCEEPSVVPTGHTHILQRGCCGTEVLCNHTQMDQQQLWEVPQWQWECFWCWHGQCSTHASAHLSANIWATCALTRHQPGHYSFLYQLWGEEGDYYFSFQSHYLRVLITVTSPEDSATNNHKSNPRLQTERQLIHTVATKWLW